MVHIVAQRPDYSFRSTSTKSITRFAADKRATIETPRYRQQVQAELLATPIFAVDGEPYLTWDLLQDFQDNWHNKKRAVLFGPTMGSIIQNMFIDNGDKQRAMQAYINLEKEGLIKTHEGVFFRKLEVTPAGVEALAQGRPARVFDPIYRSWRE